MKKTICYILTLLPLAVTVIALPFLPEKIPAHYGMNGQVTRWGSKYETLFLPVIIILFGLFMMLAIRSAAKKEAGGTNNEKVGILATLLSLGIFNIMTLFFLYTDFCQVEDLSVTFADHGRVLFGLWGIFMILIGNVMPKLRRNSLIGLRTKWSMKNEVTWKKSQFAGGVSFIIAGVAIIFICAAVPDIDYLLWSVWILGILLVADIFITYKIAKKY